MKKSGCDLVFPHFKKKKEKKRKKSAPKAPWGGAAGAGRRRRRAGGAEGAPEARARTTRLLKLAYGHGYMYLLSLVGSDSLTVNVPDSARLRVVRVLQLRERSRFGLLGRLRGRHGRVPSASAKATSPRQAARNRRRNAKFFPRHRAPRGPGWALALRSRRWAAVAAGAWLEMGRRRRAARSRPPSAGSRLLARPVLGGGADWQAHWWARWPVQA